MSNNSKSESNDENRNKSNKNNKGKKKNKNTKTNNNNNNTNKLWVDSLRTFLVKEGYCFSLEESDAIVESILLDDEDGSKNGAVCESYNDDSNPNPILENLRVTLGLTSQEAQYLWHKCFPHLHNSHDLDIDDEEKKSTTFEDLSYHNDGGGIERTVFDDDDDDEHEDDDGDTTFYIGEGECEFCERDQTSVKLTKHHLAPRSVWPRIETRLLNAVRSRLQDGNWDGARRLLAGTSDSLCDIVEQEFDALQQQSNYISSKSNKTNRTSSNFSEAGDVKARAVVRHSLDRTCLVCRQCHRCIHRTHDNLTLALHYNSVDRLLQDSTIYNFAKWASKQKRGAGK